MRNDECYGMDKGMLDYYKNIKVEDVLKDSEEIENIVVKSKKKKEKKTEFVQCPICGEAYHKKHLILDVE